VFGSAFHKFSEYYYKTDGDFPTSLFAAQEYFETAEKEEPGSRNAYLDAIYLAKLCQRWPKVLKETRGFYDLEIQRNPKDNVPLVEQKFAIPLFKSAPTDTQDIEILLTGTMDGIYKVRGSGLPVIGDIKTTSATNVRGYFAGYDLSTQLLTYTYALRYIASKYPEGYFGRLLQKAKMGAVILGVFTHGSIKEPEFVTSDIKYYSDGDLMEYERTLQRMVMRLVTHFQSGAERPLKEGLVTGACQESYGSECPYASACKAPGDRGFWGVLNSHYKVVEYNPLAFRD
jgi:hypothetical protein